MSKKLSLWDLYQRQDEIDQQLISHTHHYNDLTGFHSCASTGVADRALSSDSANKVKNDLILKNSSGNNVNYNGSSQVDLSGGVYYAATAGTTKQSTNSDTVDNLHAYQMATLSETGNPNGTSHVLTCKYNTDRDGKFKFMTSNNIPVKCDYANDAKNAENSSKLNGYNLDQIKSKLFEEIRVSSGMGIITYSNTVRETIPINKTFKNNYKIENGQYYINGKPHLGSDNSSICKLYDYVCKYDGYLRIKFKDTTFKITSTNEYFNTLNGIFLHYYVVGDDHIDMSKEFAKKSFNIEIKSHVDIPGELIYKLSTTGAGEYIGNVSNYIDIFVNAGQHIIFYYADKNAYLQNGYTPFNTTYTGSIGSIEFCYDFI